MNKRDRVANLLSLLIWFVVLPSLVVLLHSVEVFWLGLGIPLYWGYRFIQGDISFLPKWFSKD